MTTELLDADESAIEDADGDGGLPIGVFAGVGGVAMAVALGLLVFCLWRRRKQKQQLQVSNVAITVNKTTLDTGDTSASGSTSAKAPPTSKVEVHLEKDQLQPTVSHTPAPKSTGAAGSSSDDGPRKTQLADREAAAAQDSEAPEADEVLRGGQSPQGLNGKMWLGGGPNHSI